MLSELGVLHLVGLVFRRIAISADIYFSHAIRRRAVLRECFSNQAAAHVFGIKLADEEIDRRTCALGLLFVRNRATPRTGMWSTRRDANVDCRIVLRQRQDHKNVRHSTKNGRLVHLSNMVFATKTRYLHRKDAFSSQVPALCQRKTMGRFSIPLYFFHSHEHRFTESAGEQRVSSCTWAWSR